MKMPNSVEITVLTLGPDDSKERVEQIINFLLGLPIRSDRGSTIGVVESAYIEDNELKVLAVIDPAQYIKSFTDLMANVSAQISKELHK